MNYLNTEGPYRLFQSAVNSEIFVDKSMLIREISKVIGTGSRSVCITRPRRFGKSINACAAPLDQIKERNYIAKATEHAREILLVGISYDKTRKRHDCVIEGVEGCGRNQ